MPYNATPTTDGNYAVKDDSGKLISTGTKDILSNYGLSEGNLGGLAKTPSVGSVPSEPQVKSLPGIGTLTVTPKQSISQSAVPIPQKTDVGDNASGLYARTGVTPPATTDTNTNGLYQVEKSNTPEGYETIFYPAGKTPDASLAYPGAPAPSATKPTFVPGLPSYPQDTPTTPQSDLSTLAKNMSDQIDEISKKILASDTPTDEETALQKELVDKKAQLATFDTDLQTRLNNLTGQGRGTTLPTIALQDAQERRSSALERLGLAQEADTLTNQLSLATEDRKNMSQEAQDEYNLATKKFDIALNLQDKISSLNQTQQDKARQYLLDVVTFAGSKTYDQLDPTTQNEITKTVANSPITLDMVKTALSSASEKAEATANGNLRTIPGLGLVQVDPKTLKYKVVIPENVSGKTTFSQTQINSGAGKAGVAPEIFKTYDDATKNVFINGDLNGSKKIIDGEIKNGTSADDIISGLKDLQLPEKVQDYLTTYAQGQLDNNKPLTVEDQKTSITQTLKDLQTSGYARGEAEDTIRKELSDSGKTTIPSSIDKVIKDSVVSVYGRTFWDKILPGGE